MSTSSSTPTPSNTTTAPAPPPTGPRAAVKSLTCYYWYTHGYCRKSDTVCAYAHYWTGKLAGRPQRTEVGQPALAGKNLREWERSCGVTAGEHEAMNQKTKREACAPQALRPGDSPPRQLAEEDEQKTSMSDNNNSTSPHHSPFPSSYSHRSSPSYLHPHPYPHPHLTAYTTALQTQNHLLTLCHSALSTGRSALLKQAFILREVARGVDNRGRLTKGAAAKVLTAAAQMAMVVEGQRKRWEEVEGEWREVWAGLREEGGEGLMEDEGEELEDGEYERGEGEVVERTMCYE